MKVLTVTGGDIDTNCYIIPHENKCFLIDFVPEVEAQLNILRLEVEAVLITHVHFDHFQGLSDFQKRHAFTLYLSALGKEKINDGQYSLTDTLPPYIAQKSVNVDTTNAVGLADGQKFSLCGYNITPIHTPGHSLDSIVYIIDGENTAFVGDTVFYHGVGRTDLFGGNTKQLRKSISHLLGLLDDTAILYPGHGPATSVDEVI